MPLLSALIVASGVGIAQGPPSELAESAATPLALQAIAEPAVPEVVFEIRELSVGSPDWRGVMQPMLNPIANEDGVTVWAVDGEGMRRLMEACQDDPHMNLLTAPKMKARLGESARMTNEEAVQYIAHLKRLSDAPLNEGTSIAFEPQTAEIQQGVRVEVSGTRLKGPAIYGHVAVRSNVVVNMLTAQYEESIVPPADDPGVVKASLSKLDPEARRKYSLRGTVQIPEVASRRIEGDWLIPSDGALVVSLGPHSDIKMERKPRPGEKVGGLARAFGGKSTRRAYFEKIICITAYTQEPSVESAPAEAPAHP